MPVAIQKRRLFLPEYRGMNNERETQRDVRWLDEAGLHRAVLGGDREAFAELMWRYDPLVRSRLKGCASDEKLEVEIADFWCAMIADDLRSLRTWDQGRGGTLGQWLMVLAAYACKAKLRPSERAA
ncbi:MAG TPA: hypothetical protein VF334_13215 [Polyangia bacterium]